MFRRFQRSGGLAAYDLKTIINLLYKPHRTPLRISRQ